MDAKLLFWTGALALLAAMAACAAAGWRAVRRGEVEAHRRWMERAIALVGVFLVAYVFKVVLLGKEDLSAWSRAAVWNLRVHELIVLVMLVAGAAARWIARGFTRGARSREAAGPPERRRRHRLAGRTAALASLLALATATVILIGMYLRA